MIPHVKSGQTENAGELKELSAFMLGSDKATLGRMIGYFSVPGKYLHPRELKKFWETLKPMERACFRREMRMRVETL